MQSTYAKIIKEVCSEENIELSAFSYDWVFSMKKEGKFRYILAYHFDLNTAAVQAICKDKSAASDILSHHGIPCVLHSIFMSPSSGYTPKEGNGKYLHALLDKYGKIVCKPNEGASGTNVFAVSTGAELEAAADKIWKTAQSMALSPYYDIEKEFRVIVLNGEVKLIFSKEIPYIKGDGRSTLAQLLAAEGRGVLSAELMPLDLGVVLQKDETFKLGWKHNLAHGAVPQIVSDEAVISGLSKLALKAATAMNIKFASIDIILAEGGYKILEVNSGVMMEHFASSSASNYEKAKKIYGEAIKLMFA